LFPIHQTYSYLSLKELKKQNKNKKKSRNSGFFKISLIKQKFRMGLVA